MELTARKMQISCVVWQQAVSRFGIAMVLENLTVRKKLF
jgi:hypothetical protein